MQFSQNELNFVYQANKHLSTTLKLKNIQNFNQIFKFKISTMNRFMIKPNVGSVQPGESVAVEIVIHKEIVPNHENEKVQLIYGKSLEDPKTIKSTIFPIIIDGFQSNLNLTTMVESKQERIRQLESQVKQFQLAPSYSSGKKQKSSKFMLKLIVAIILGLLIGFFGPIKIFKKKIVHKSS